MKTNTFLEKYGLYMIFSISLLAMLGSLFFSEIMDFPPCVLCWYQRIFLYPIAFISGVGIIRKSRDMYHYMIALLIPGFLISLYHNLLYYKIIPEHLAPCTAGISCTTKYIEMFGFLTIPLLAFAAFVILIILVVKGLKRQSTTN